MEQIPAYLGVTGPVATALAMFYLVFTGRLIPRSSHESVVQVLKERNVEVVMDRENWKSAATLANQTNADQARSTAVMLEAAKFSTHVMSALQDNASGGPHATS